MRVTLRGIRNAFRNKVRTISIVLILAISIGLALSMLVAHNAVAGRVDDLKRSMGRTVTVTPAGSQGMQGGGEPLKTADAEKIRDVAHVVDVTTVVSAVLQTEGQDDSNRVRGPNGDATVGKTDLESSIDAGTLGRRFGGAEDEEGEAPKVPISVTGTSGTKDVRGSTIKVIDGRALRASDTRGALVGVDLAEKNDLKVGATFTAWGQTFTVVGVFDDGTEFGNAGVIMPIATVQELAEVPDEVSTIFAEVDSVENLEAAADAIRKALGSDKADVVVPEQNTRDAIDGLKSVQRVSVVGFVMALLCAAVVIFLTMLMIVRERRREIGVLKAIGGSNRGVITQFVAEAVTLVALGIVVGLGVALASANSMANALVSSNVDSTADSSSSPEGPRADGPGGPRQGGSIRVNRDPEEQLESAKDLVGDIKATVGPATIGYGLLGGLGVAVLGSAVPAYFIARIRPAEALRGE